MLLFVAWEHYQDYARKLEEANRVLELFVGVVKQMTGSAPLVEDKSDPGVPPATSVTTLGRLDVLDFDRVFAVNVRGTFVPTQAALKHLKAGGRIIMIGSCLGERVFLPGMAPYAATKGAVKMFTQGLARELGARGITVSNVQAGPIDTDLNPAAGESAVGQKAAVPLGRYGRADEVAALVAFVAGPESSYVNGANLTVDGGTNA
jgi:NAD(P)-dependent dehydrogenase (short-subunit alcohol dehydrogenase family)